MEALYVNILIYSLQFGAVGAASSSWRAEVPSRVSGLLGSCVVVPCSFTFPPPPEPHESLRRSPAASELMTGMWAEQGHRLIYHPDRSKVVGKYRNRTALLGDLGRGQCSLKIDPLGEGDAGPFHFRIEIKDHDKFSYLQSPVSITLTSSPQPMRFWVREEEVRAGDNVTASCSVTHSCPSDPPAFSWSRPGHSHLRSAGLADGQWNATSTLRFEAAREDHGRPLGCAVTYRGGRTQSSPPAVLRVKYPPVNVRVSYHNEEAGVREGEDVTLTCSSVANPPAHLYRWYDGAPPPDAGAALRYTGHAYTLRRVTRRHAAGALYCTATNTEGHGASRAVRLNVLYPPEIKAGSACSWDSLKAQVTCVCMVDSRPASTIHWSLPDSGGRSHHHQAPPGGGARLETHGVVTIGTLQVQHGATGPAHCHAFNSQGNATVALAFPSDDHHSLMLYVAAAIGGLFVLLVIFLTALGVTKKWKETLTDSMVFCNVYTNDHLYGNMEADVDDDPYECAMDDHAIYANL